MFNLTSSEQCLNADQRRLLGGWRDIRDDIRIVCRNLADLRAPDGGDCDAQLAGLRPAIDALTVDSLRFFPMLRELLTHAGVPAAARAENGIEIHIADVVRSFGQLVVAADAFKAECRSSHLNTIKEDARALLQEAERLDRVL